MNLHNYFLLKRAYVHFNKQAGALESIGGFFGGLAGKAHNADEKFTEEANRRWKESGGLEGLADRTGKALAAPVKGVFNAADAIDEKVVNPLRRGFSAGYKKQVNPGSIETTDTTAATSTPATNNNSLGRFNTSIPGLAATAAGGVAGGMGGHYLANRLGLYDNYNPNGRLLGHALTAGGAIGGAALGNFGANLVSKHW